MTVIIVAGRQASSSAAGPTSPVVAPPALPPCRVGCPGCGLRCGADPHGSRGLVAVHQCPNGHQWTRTAAGVTTMVDGGWVDA